MADSIRHRLASAIVDRMKLINGTGGYATNVNSRVADSETPWAEDQDTLPAISVFDGESDPTPTVIGAEEPHIFNLMTFYIRGYVRQGSTAKNARDLLKDIMKAVRVDQKWTVSGTKLAMQTMQGPDTIIRNPDNFQVEGCELQIAIKFKTSFFNAEE